MVSVQPQTDVYLIQKSWDLEELARVLHGEKLIAVDTESNSLYAYREQVCLIQFSTLQADYLVDPLALDDISPLKPVFEEPGIEKVFHAAEYDLICLHRDFNFHCARIFDTMLAARILGRQEVGLGAMLENEFGVHLDKRQQRANWGERPLSERLIDYARLDTHYLIALRDRLEAELQERGMLQLAQEDFERACTSRSYENGRGGTGQRPMDCWRVCGAHDLEPQKAAVLQELCRYRDQAARAMNRPLFKVINDRTLLAIAAETPGSLAELAKLPGMSPGQIHRHGAALLRAVQRGLASEPIYPPKSPRPDERYLHRLEALRTWRKQAAQDMGAPSDVILPRELMYTIAEGAPKTIVDLSVLLHDSPWRLEHFGEQLLEFLHTYRR
jgi:ribonuclease D